MQNQREKNQFILISDTSDTTVANFDAENKHNWLWDTGRELLQVLQPIEGYQNLLLISLKEPDGCIVFCCLDTCQRVCIAMSNSENLSDGLNQNDSASI